MIPQDRVAHEAGEPELLAVHVRAHQMEAGGRAHRRLQLGAYAVGARVARRQPGSLHRAPGQRTSTESQSFSLLYFYYYSCSSYSLSDPAS
jgi:hypothetical protein